MSKISTVDAARTAIRTAVATDAALVEARTANRDAWSKAYALVWSARQGGASVADVAKGSGVSGATVSACELSAMLDHPASWARLEALPARKGQRRTTIHSLVLAAIATKAKGDVPAIRAVIADLTSKVAKIDKAAKDAGVEPDASRIADHYSAAIGKVADLTADKGQVGKREKTDDNHGDHGDHDNHGDQGDQGDGPDMTVKADTVESRVGRVTADLISLRDVLSKASDTVSADALHGLMRESGALARDIADLMADRHARKAG